MYTAYTYLWSGNTIDETRFFLEIQGMAKQVGPFYITGCYDNVCWYRMDGKYYARMKSSLTRKRVKTDRAFTKTMHNATLLGQASKSASYLYKQLPKDERKHSYYRELTGKALLLLREGKTNEEVIVILNGSSSHCKKETSTKKSFADELLKRVFDSVLPDNDIDSSFSYVSERKQQPKKPAKANDPPILIDVHAIPGES